MGSENCALAECGLLLNVHLIVLLVRLNEVYIGYSRSLLYLVAEGDFVAFTFVDAVTLCVTSLQRCLCINGDEKRDISLECRWPTPAAVINKEQYLPLLIDEVLRMDNIRI